MRPISRAGDTVTRSERAPRLILRFAAGSLVAFLLVGVGVGALVVHYVRGRVERIGTFHAQFVARAVLAPAFRGVDLSAPVTASTLCSRNACSRTAATCGSRSGVRTG